MKIVMIVFGGIAFIFFVVGIGLFVIWGLLPKVNQPEFNKPTGGVVASGKAFATGYCPENSKLEGGLFDVKGKRLVTLQQYLEGKSTYVSVAMDSALFKQYPYGSVVHIPELDAKFNSGKPIEFRFVDTGGSFTGTSTHPLDHQKKPRGLTAIDIANDCNYMYHGWGNLSVTINMEGSKPASP